MDAHLALLVGVGVTALIVLLVGRLWGGDANRIARDDHQRPKAAPLRAMLLGADGRASTSKATAAGWTVVVAFMLASVATLVVVDGGGIGDRLDQLGSSYLLLLGGPFAALVLAKGITVARLKNGTLTKTSQPPQFDASDLASDDSGQTDLVDFQFLVFNTLAALYVLAAFVIRPGDGLPDVPTALGGLTSVSALTFTANKAVATSPSAAGDPQSDTST